MSVLDHILITNIYIYISQENTKPDFLAHFPVQGGSLFCGPHIMVRHNGSERQQLLLGFRSIRLNQCVCHFLGKCKTLSYSLEGMNMVKVVVFQLRQSFTRYPGNPRTRRRPRRGPAQGIGRYAVNIYVEFTGSLDALFKACTLFARWCVALRIEPDYISQRIGNAASDIYSRQLLRSPRLIEKYFLIPRWYGFRVVGMRHTQKAVIIDIWTSDTEGDDHRHLVSVTLLRRTLNPLIQYRGPIAKRIVEFGNPLADTVRLVMYVCGVHIRMFNDIVEDLHPCRFFRGIGDLPALPANDGRWRQLLRYCPELDVWAASAAARRRGCTHAMIMY